MRALLDPERSGRDIDEELRLHIELETGKYEAKGLTHEAARRRAMIAFGAYNTAHEELRASRGIAWLQSTSQDIRYALRVLCRSPVLVTAAALTLAIGIGANTAVFGMISATLLRPLPFPDSDRLIAVHHVPLERAATPRDQVWSYPEFTHVRATLDADPANASRQIEIAAWYADDVDMVACNGDPEHRTAEIVSADYFEVLGVRAAAGRTFSPDEDARAGTHPVAVVRSRTGEITSAGDAVVGSTILVNGVPLTVIGVMPSSFRGLSGTADVWITHMMAPFVSFPRHLTTDDRFLRIAGRAGHRTSIEAARTQLSRVRSPADSEEPWHATAVQLNDARRDPDTLRAQGALAGASLLLLLIAVVNFSGLLLARASARSREAALRIALGASRGRVVRGMLIESGLIGMFGGALGIVLALIAAPRLAGAAQLDTLLSPQLDWRAFAFGGVLSLLCGIVAGVVPALRSSRGDVALSVGHSSRGHSVAAGTLRRPTLLSTIAVVQFACALVLLVGAGVLLDGFRQLRALDTGIRAEGVLTFRISPSDSRYQGDAASRLLEDVLERVAAVPGVQSATVGRCLPGTGCSFTPLYRPGLPEDDAPVVRRHYVGPDHFITLGVPLLRGRLLTDADRAGRPRVAVINEHAAQRLWPDEDVVGKRVWFGSGGGFASPDSLTEIVGIVADVRYGAADSAMEPDFYTSYQQYVLPETMVLVRTSADAAALLPGMRSAVRAADPGLAIHDVRSAVQIGADAMAAERTATTALILFAAIGLFLAAIGVYGLLSWSVTQRRREIGIRLAVGATPARVMTQVIREGTTLAAVGLVIGAIASFGFARTLSAIIPGLRAPDATILATVSGLLVLVAAFTCFLPARTAARVDPCTTLTD